MKRGNNEDPAALKGNSGCPRDMPDGMISLTVATRWAVPRQEMKGYLLRLRIFLAG